MPAMLRSVTGALILSLALSAASCADTETLARQQRDLQALRERVGKVERVLAELKGSAPLEQQERCSRQAALVFRQLGYNVLDNYENHFNTKSGRCFLYISAIRRVQGETISEKTILDAFEMKHYGSMTRGAGPLPESCEVLDDAGDPMPCDKITDPGTDVTRFRAYTKRLMSE
jgi:hypothetical protein